eukprot:CAMPEP_0118946624 /NCGR_PEP_ID=MMETSP1169-20130426/44537_1 /TAXON_ID=36882 /ORGANISM="Pyramimonas obovata, Strain CCMP722" /LENGTH=41 /DNA_ID= /DNA_START= /DNA_END= /DNA_ORIENTATION=
MAVVLQNSSMPSCIRGSSMTLTCAAGTLKAGQAASISCVLN